MNKFLGSALLILSVIILCGNGAFAEKKTYAFSHCNIENHALQLADCHQSGMNCVGECWIEGVDWAYCQFDPFSSCTKDLGVSVYGLHTDYACAEDAEGLCNCDWGKQIGTHAYSTTADACVW